MNENDTVLVDRYLEAVKAAGLDQTAAGERIGVTQQTISDWLARRQRKEDVTIRKGSVRQELRDFLLSGPGINRDFRDGVRYAVEQMGGLLGEMRARLDAGREDEGDSAFPTAPIPPVRKR